MRRIILLAIFVSIASCGSGSNSNTGGGAFNIYKPHPVSYSLLKDGAICRQTSKQSRFNGTSGYQSHNCRWFCGTDNVYNREYVSITFEKPRGSSSWVLDRIYRSDGICR